MFTASHSFTGKERDTESGLDYFGARYYASNMGRFLSPDWSASPTGVPYADLMNPQSLNLYEYVGNNPLSQADPDGHCCERLKQFTKSFGTGAAKYLYNEMRANAIRMGPAVSESQGMMDIGGNTVPAMAPNGAAENLGFYAVPVAQVAVAVVLPEFGGEVAVMADAPAMLQTEGAASTGYIGDNIVQGSGRVNSDLPGGMQAAQDTFSQQTAGQATSIDPKTGQTVAADGTRLRTAADGTGRVERPTSVTGDQHETVHFKTPDKQP